MGRSKNKVLARDRGSSQGRDAKIQRRASIEDLLSAQEERALKSSQERKKLRVSSPYEAAKKRAQAQHRDTYGDKTNLEDGSSMSMLRLTPALRQGWNTGTKDRINSPYALNFIRTDDSLDPIIFGAAEKVSDEFERHRFRRWTVEIVIGLSRANRVRAISFATWTPQKSAVDPEAFRRAGYHQNWKKSHAIDKSTNVRTDRFFLEEWRRFDGEEEHPDLPEMDPALRERMRTNMITVPGVLAYLDSVSSWDIGNHGKVNHPLFRIGYEGRVGICFGEDQLKNQQTRDIIGNWLEEIVQASSGDSRFTYPMVKGGEVYLGEFVRRTDMHVAAAHHQFHHPQEYLSWALEYLSG